MLKIILLVPGFALLVVGAWLLVEGASAVARRLRVSDLAIGLTVVAFGTSAPELVVNIFAAVQGDPGIAMGNILGSNTFNILVILGISALICPLAVGSGTVWKEIPMSLLAAVMVGILANDAWIDGGGVSALTRIDGLVLLCFFVIFLFYVLGMARTGVPAPAGGPVPGAAAGPGAPAPASDTPPAPRPSPLVPPASPLLKAVVLVVVGLAALNVGAKLVVDGAVAIAQAAGVTSLAIGLTIVAAGTSLPELATSAVAAWKRNADIAVGNIVGSNIFNIFLILGVSSLIRPLPMPQHVNLDIAMTILASLLLFAAMFTGRRPNLLERWEGTIYLALYVAYIAYRLTWV